MGELGLVAQQNSKENTQATEAVILAILKDLLRGGVILARAPSRGCRPIGGKLDDGDWSTA